MGRDGKGWEGMGRDGKGWKKGGGGEEEEVGGLKKGERMTWSGREEVSVSKRRVFGKNK